MSKIDKIVSKINKLLAMADIDSGATDNERATAIRQATYLMDLHTIDMSLENKEDERGTVDVNLGPHIWRKNIIASIGMLYGCVVYNSKVRGQKVIIIAGKESYRDVVLNLGLWIIDSIAKEVRLKKIGRTQADSFKKGAASGLQHTVRSIIEERKKGETVNSSEKGLMVTSIYKNESDSNKEYLRSTGVHLTPGKAAVVSNKSAFDSGVNYGKSINLSKQINGD